MLCQVAHARLEAAQARQAAQIALQELELAELDRVAATEEARLKAAAEAVAHATARAAVRKPLTMLSSKRGLAL
jgi:hypothetical protein